MGRVEISLALKLGYRLCDLPADILTLITDLLPGESIGRLWLSGNKKLNEVLGELGGVRRCTIVWNGIGPFVWPLMFSKLVFLQELSFKNHENIKSIRFKSINLNLVTATLQKLELIGPGVEDLFEPTYNGLEHFAFPKDHFNQLKTLVISDWKHISIMNCLAQIPGSLTKFKIAKDPLRGILPTVTPDILRLLPKYLETLHMECSFENPSPNTEPFLPETLKQISKIFLSFEKSRNFFFQNLPPNITKLSWCSSSSKMKHWHFMDTLPPSLLHISLYCYSADLEKLEKLPPNLLHFKIYVLRPFSEAMLAVLPKTLKKLDIRCNAAKGPWSGAVLPAGLTDLGNTEFALSEVSQLSELPRNLKRVVIRTSFSTPGNLPLQQLPNTVEDLELKSWSPNSIVIEMYPPHLTRLKLLGEPIDYISIEHFPTTLRHLEFGKLRISAEDLAIFPRNLSSLNISILKIHGPSSDSILYVSESMVYLRIEQLYTGSGSLTLAGLEKAQNLETLDLTPVLTFDLFTFNSLPKSLTYISLSIEGAINQDYLEELPVKLRHLALFPMRNGTRLTDESMALLPHSLTELYLPYSPSLTENA